MTIYYLFYFCTDKVLYYHDLTTKVDKNNGGHVVARWPRKVAFHRQIWKTNLKLFNPQTKICQMFKPWNECKNLEKNLELIMPNEWS